MLDYLQKYNQLPNELRDKMSDKSIVEAINRLEKNYKINLAILIVKIIIKDINVQDVVNYLMNAGLNVSDAKKLEQELLESVFKPVADYLGVEEKKSIVPESKAEAFLKQRAQRPRSKAGKADYYFSPEDEEEIKKFKNGNIVAPPILDYEKIVNDIIKEIGVNFSSALLQERLKQILMTFLKGIRDKISAKQTLCKPIDSGGLGFDEYSAAQMLLMAEKKIKTAPTLETGAAKIALQGGAEQKILRDYEYNLASELKKKEEATLIKKVDTEPETPLSHMLLNKTSGLTQKLKSMAAKDIELPQKKEEAQNVWTDKIPAQTAPPLRITESIQGAAAETQQIIKTKSLVQAGQTAESAGKVRMDDIKFIPKSFGPVEELKYFNLAGFRRLSKNPKEAAAKIKQKISLLEEESYAKKLEGIKAWRNNPVNRLYLEIGNNSISKSKPINDIIEERIAQGAECLTANEFEAIMDLNKELRF